MWKFLSRGVREAVERNLNIGRSTTTTEVRVQKDKPQVNFCQLIAPYVNKWKHCGSSQFENESQKNEHSTGFRHSWFGAFSCSGALALGWVLAQPCLWRKWVDRPEHGRWHRYQALFNISPPIAWTQPILTGRLDVAPVHFCNEVGVNAGTPSPVKGPKTAEEAVQEAADEFRNVHNSILAEIENKRAVDLIKRQKNREALELFVSASHRGHGPAAYNLAQCFELGIGIKQNFHEAAKWYQTAVDRGHLTAMYNLGVFYAHGWGGLTPDSNKARSLFREAAKRGQPDAKAALGLQETPAADVSPQLHDAEKGDSWNNDVVEFSSSLSDISNNPEAIFNLASSIEASTDWDPISDQLMLEMYKIAADMGHAEARRRATVLQTFANIAHEELLSLDGRGQKGFTSLKNSAHFVI